MGMFAGVFVGSFRINSATSSRIGLQVSSLRILVPSLLPMFSHSGGARIDYGAHFGGAVAGAALALVLFQCWPETAFIPQWRRGAAITAVASLVLFVASAGLVTGNFSRYQAAVARQSNPPATSQTAGDLR